MGTRHCLGRTHFVQGTSCWFFGRGDGRYARYRRGNGHRSTAVVIGNEFACQLCHNELHANFHGVVNDYSVSPHKFLTPSSKTLLLTVRHSYRYVVGKVLPWDWALLFGLSGYIAGICYYTPTWTDIVNLHFADQGVSVAVCYACVCKPQGIRRMLLFY